MTDNTTPFTAVLQLCLARRLVVDRRESGLNGLRSVEAALNSAHDALSLMDAPQAWLEVPPHPISPLQLLLPLPLYAVALRKQHRMAAAPPEQLRLPL